MGNISSSTYFQRESGIETVKLLSFFYPKYSSEVINIYNTGKGDSFCAERCCILRKLRT